MKTYIQSKFILILLLFFVVFYNSMLAQDIQIEWQKTIGADHNDYFWDMEITSDGGFILGGTSFSNMSGDKTEDLIGIMDYWVVKLDSFGDIEWENTIGGNLIDQLQIVKQTVDGGYILGGSSDSGVSGDKTESSPNGNLAYWIVKLNSSGSIEWQNTIGGSGNDRFYSLQQTTDGGYIIGGYSDSDISGDKTENSQGSNDYWVVKLDSFGVIEWQNTIGGDVDDELYYISQTQDGGYILGGSSDSSVSGDKTEASTGGIYDHDYWIVKLNSSGTIEWQNTIGGDRADRVYNVIQIADGGYIVSGVSVSGISGDKTETNFGNFDYWIVKLDTNGAVIWENTIGGGLNENVHFTEEESDGFILGGFSESNMSPDKSEDSKGGADFWIIKLDTSGNIVWENTIGGSDFDQCKSIHKMFDGGYIAAGTSNSDISGDKTENSNGLRDFWLMKLYESPLSIQEFDLEDKISLYPNPSNSTSTIDFDIIYPNISLELLDVLGKSVYRKKYENTDSIELNIESLAPGIYFIRLEVKNSLAKLKLVKKS